MPQTTAIAVEKGIAIPSGYGDRKRKYPWHQLEPGDSFFVPVTDENLFTRVRSSLTNGGRAAFGKGAVTIRKADGGFRVWRVA